MRFRLLAIPIAALLIFAACGGGTKVKDKAAGAGASATPAVPGAESTGPAGEQATGAPGAAASAAPGATAKPGEATAAPAAKTAPPAPVKEAKPGEINEPRLGKYVYHMTGTSTNPFATPDPTKPGQTPAPSKIDREDSQEITDRKQTDKGVEFTTRSGGQQGGASQITRYESNRILLVRTSFSGQQGSVNCEFNTPEGGLMVSRIPIKAEKLPKQEWSNSECSGTHEVEILGQEDVADETGKTWKTWKAQVKTTIKIPSQQAELTLDQTVWVSPDLGEEVKNHGLTDGKFGTFTFKSDTTRVLKSYP